MSVLNPSARELFEVARGLGQQVLQFALQEIRADQRRRSPHARRIRGGAGAEFFRAAADRPLSLEGQIATPADRDRAQPRTTRALTDLKHTNNTAPLAAA